MKARIAGVFLPYVIAALSTSASFALLPNAGAQAAPRVPGGDVFAVVGDHVVTLGEYQSALAAGMRQKFYHAKPLEAEVVQYQREIGDQLIDRVLLLGEAKRRGIEPDRGKIDATVSGYEERYKANAQWRANREKLLPGLIEQLERQSVLERFEKQIKALPAPGEAQVRAYYEKNQGLFTEPEQVRLSLILLKVDPSSPRVVWEKAAEEGDRIYQRLQKGADFAETARMQSADPSSANGGDLGYLHRGMLSSKLQDDVVDTLKPGMIAPPLRTLEGIAIVRLADRKPPALRGFADVRPRAEELWLREQGDLAWKALIAELRSKTRISVDESRFLAVAPK